LYTALTEVLRAQRAFMPVPFIYMEEGRILQLIALLNVCKYRIQAKRGNKMGSKLRNLAIAILAIVSGISFSSISFADSQGFTDVDNSNPYALYIQDLQVIGAINGTENGNFNLTRSITRAEFVKL
jgi:hypothetical protein